MDELEVYHDTAVFGPHRWMIRGSNNRNISEAQFSSAHDAKAAIRVGHAIGRRINNELAERIRDLLP